MLPLLAFVCFQADYADNLSTAHATKCFLFSVEAKRPHCQRTMINYIFRKNSTIKKNLKVYFLLFGFK
tara:strand:- start:6302 stop:6505 length:204 start_codon:yes stop_codon:yes gene_type:complete